MTTSDVYMELEHVLQERFGGSLSLFEEVVELSAFRISTLLSDLKTSSERGHHSDIEQAAHALYNVVSLFHGQVLGARLQNIERNARQGHANLSPSEFVKIERECGEIIAELLQFLQHQKSLAQAS